jgi:hypothetical protein
LIGCLPNVDAILDILEQCFHKGADELFRIIPVSDQVPEIIEPLGTKRKFWFRDENSNSLLFKEGTEGTGDNWSEKVSCELCGLLGIPHACYELAAWRGRAGVITPSFVPEDGRLILGNELLSKIVGGYPARRFFRVSQHTLGRVLAVMKNRTVRPPIGWESARGLDSAISVFIGYLMLDAWIANQDRHHENWALLVTRDREFHLAPSYDHASGLGRNETDRNRQDRLTTRDKRRSMASYVEKATSAFFMQASDRKPLSTVEAFHRAARHHFVAARAWLERLGEISPTAICNVFDMVPSGLMSEVAADFAKEMLQLNKARLLGLRERLR